MEGGIEALNEIAHGDPNFEKELFSDPTLREQWETFPKNIYEVEDAWFNELPEENAKAIMEYLNKNYEWYKPLHEMKNDELEHIFSAIDTSTTGD